MTGRIAACAAAVVVVVSIVIIPYGHASGDVIVTTGGARWEGKVTEDGDAYILVTANGSTMRFPKNMVAEVIKTEEQAATEPAAEAGGKPGEAGADGADDVAEESTAGLTPYVIVPIKGAIGTDVVCGGVEELLKRAARRRDLTHVVVVLRTSGGSPEMAEKIAELMRTHDERFQYHAIVEEAVGAGVWVALACDEIHMVEGSTLGAATFANPADAAPEDDPARTAALATARLAALGTAKGRPSVLVRAMIAGDEEAYAWTDEDGKVSVSNSPPDVPGDRIIFRNDARRPLVLTAEQAVKVGLARPLAGSDPADLGSALGVENWTEVIKNTDAVMARAKRKLEYERTKAETEARELEAKKKQNEQRTQAAAAYVKQSLAEAEKADPRNYTYYYDPSDGYFTAASAQSWTRHTDQAIAAWQRVQKGAVTLRELEKEAEKLGMEKIDHGVDPAGVYQQAENEIQRLKSERRKLKP